MELRRYVAILRRRLLIILLTTAAGILGGYASTDQTPRYTATATVYVGSRNLLAVSGASLGGDVLNGLEQISRTYAAMIDSAPVASDAVQRANVARSPQSVVGETQAFSEKGTQLLRVNVVDRDPATAQLLANGLTDAFIEKISTFEPSAAPQPGEIPAAPAYIFEKASLPATPQPTSLVRQLILGALVGFAVAAGIAFVLEYIDITVKTVSDAERKLELPVLGVIPMDTDARQTPRTEVWSARAS
ncbi:MAG: hypothetical protein H0W70_01235 [Actinobacteria bacterium]|nr:hypothetical protein [Actinomycetota bacterium]